MSERQSIILLICIIPVLLIQGLWIFKDAKKRGEKYYWLWGIFGLLNIPSNIITYLIVTRIIIDRYGKNSK